MFRKYEKTFRLIGPHGKLTLSNEDIGKLLVGKVVIEEKMDGANVGIIRHKKGFHLQKRGSLVGQSEHEQFGYFHNWANVQNYEKLMALPMNHIVYGELLYAVHHLYYDKLPDYFLSFDVWNGQRYLNYEERTEFCNKYGFFQVPLISEGNYSKLDVQNMMPKESKYGEMAEGIVIKRYSKREYLRAKLVKPEFIKQLDESEHWSTYSIRKNVLVAAP